MNFRALRDTLRAALGTNGGWWGLLAKARNRLVRDGWRGLMGRLAMHLRRHQAVLEARQALTPGGGWVASEDYCPAPDELQQIGSPRIGVMVHVFYPDLLPELLASLKQMPVPYRLLISVVSEAHRQLVLEQLAQAGAGAGALVKVVPNRGRNLAPLLVGFRDELGELDLLCHVHTKKSLYSGGERRDWRQYLWHTLLGAPGRVRAILALFAHRPQVGICYPETFADMPYWAHTWLANRAEGQRLLADMGVHGVDFSQYIDYPLGSMFWVRVPALAPLLDLGLTLDDFPPEQGQTDGTLQHALERCLVFAALAAGYEQRLIPAGAEHRFLTRNHKNLHQYLAVPLYERILAGAQDASLVSFDIFDTLLIRPFADPDAVLHQLSQQLAEAGQLTGFFAKRKGAEQAARQAKASGDVGLDEIYQELARREGLEPDQARSLMAEEIAAEQRCLGPRPRVRDAMRALRAQGKRLIAVSDMYLGPEQLARLLAANGMGDLDAIYVSSALGARKDQGRLWDLVLEREGVSREQLAHVGDNERSDVQILVDGRFHAPVHVLRPAALLGQLPGTENLFRLLRRRYSWRNELILGLIANRLAERLDQGERDLAIPFAAAKEFGYAVIGPLVLGFLAKLVCRAQDDQIPTLAFLSREGWLLERAYRVLREHPALAEVRDRLPSGAYLYCSRTFIGLAAVDDLGGGLDLLLGAHYAGTLGHLLAHRFGLDQEQLARYLAPEELGRRLTLPDDRPWTLDALGRCLPLIRDRAQADRALFLAYWRQTLGDQEAGLVDIGYSGTIQKALSRILARPLSGYYFATNDAARQIVADGGRCWGCYAEFSDLVNDIPVHQYGLVMEAVLTSPEGQLRGFQAQAGRIQPLFKAPGQSQLEFDRIGQIHAGVLEFVADVAAQLGPDTLSRDWDTDTLQQLIAMVATGYLDLGPLAQVLTVEDEFCGNQNLSVIDFYARRRQLGAVPPGRPWWQPAVPGEGVYRGADPGGSVV